jgi:predicted Fe-Mo cluster-binding NifX family protein
MIAIPVMRARVAPVLNWCSHILIFPKDPERGPGQELWLPELGALERLKILREKGVNTLICGALSADLWHYARQLGLDIISGVAGEVDEVLKAYWQNRLSQPEFWLPGCQGPRRYRQGCRKKDLWSANQNQGGEIAMPRGRGGGGKGGRRGGGPGGGAGGGPGKPGAGSGVGIQDFCRCPACGTRAPHERGIPCFQVTCPQCGQAMIRE